MIDWHSGDINRDTVITADFRTTQRVRRFFVAACGPDFTIDRPFRAWLKTATGKTLGDAAAMWNSRKIGQ